MTESDAIAFNREFDNHLATTGLVDQELYRRLMEAYRYDAASTVNWVDAKLTILRDRMQQGRPLELFQPTQSRTVAVSSMEDLLQWIDMYFPSARPRS